MVGLCQWRAVARSAGAADAVDHQEHAAARHLSAAARRHQRLRPQRALPARACASAGAARRGGVIVLDSLIDALPLLMAAWFAVFPFAGFPVALPLEIGRARSW